MNLDKISIEEIMGLSKLTKEAIYNALYQHGLLKSDEEKVCCPWCDKEFSEVHSESLPDLADRLWREVTSKRNLPECINFVVRMVEPECKTMSAQESWWIYNSLPIHRIQAALLALNEAGKELK